MNRPLTLDDLRMVPVDDDTLPTAEQVHLARWTVERMKRRAQAEQAERLAKQKDPKSGGDA